MILTRTEECVAVDVGGTKVDVARVRHDGVILDRRRIDTVAAGASLLDDIVREVNALGGDPALLVGVGCGGPMTAGGRTVSPLNIPVWRDLPLRDLLQQRLERSVFVDNDAKALALAEGVFGAARESQNFVAMVVSTGVGGGIVLDGRLLDGVDANAGHVGHVVVERGGARCACGTRGCLEAEASGTAIARRIGAPAATATLEERRRAGEMVGRAAASVAALLDVVDFYVAGSVALGFGDEFFGAANDAARQDAGLRFTKAITIQPSQLREDGPLLGAACVAWRSVSA